MRLPWVAFATAWCCISPAACSPAGGMGLLSFQPAPEEGIDEGEEGTEAEGGAGGEAHGPSDSQGGATSSGGTSAQGGAPGEGEPQPGGGGGAPATPCTYPTSGFGTAAGQIVNSSMTWVGYAPGSSGASKLSASSFLDCDGKAGRNALLIIHSTSWCTSCQQEAAQLEQKMTQSWAAAGVVVVEVLVENANGDPATTQTAKSWKDYYGIESTWVTADPEFQLESQAADSYPYEVLVDPRTMKIVETQAGGSMDEAVMQLAVKNGN